MHDVLEAAVSLGASSFPRSDSAAHAALAHRHPLTHHTALWFCTLARLLPFSFVPQMSVKHTCYQTYHLDHFKVYCSVVSAFVLFCN